MKDVFKLPIFYNNKKVRLRDHIIDDLELVKYTNPDTNDTNDTNDANDAGNTDRKNTSVISYFANDDNKLSTGMVAQMATFYTTDILFLKDTQELLRTFNNSNTYSSKESPESPESPEPNKYSKMMSLWSSVKNDTGFKDRYFYIEWEMFEFLNNSEKFLQCMSIYNMASPVFSLCIPIIVLIIPFFIIKLKGLHLSVSEYVSVLKTVVKNHAIGKLFSDFSNVSANEKTYIVVSAAFYVFSIYQNVLSCIRFNENMKKIHANFDEITRYLSYTICTMDAYLERSAGLLSYDSFNRALIDKKNDLIRFRENISFVTEWRVSVKNIFEIGKTLKCFYELYANDVFDSAFEYSFGFNGYIDIISGIQQNIRDKSVNFARLVSGNSKNKFIGNYYGVLKNDAPVKNDINLTSSMIITGPNAAGKTTILKSTILNIIFTQQFGVGFYDDAVLKPYDYIHCYLNIPDTSGRDSLFQSEARRCKEIIDAIADADDRDTHFCGFDELYSGTNPSEAVQSSVSFMKYLANRPNVSYVLTTHFIKMCKKIERSVTKNVINYKMVTVADRRGGDSGNSGNVVLKHTYKLKRGISKIKGGIYILRELNYPLEITNAR